MAISVTGLTVHTQTGGGTWQDWGTGGGSSSTTATYLSSTSARGRKYTGAKGFGFEVNAGGTDLSNSILVVRFLVNGGLGATLAAGGASIRAEDTSGNISDWYVAGSDTYNGGWFEAVIDTANAESANNGTAATLTTIQYVGMYINAAASSGGDPNVYVDEVLSMPNTGLTLAGNTANLFEEAADWDETSQYGVITRRSGVIFAKCPLILSPDASNHVSTDETVVFEEPVYEDGTNIDSALTLIGLSSADADTITLTRLNVSCFDNGDITGTSSDKELDFASATDIVASTCFFTGFTGTTCALGGSGNSYDDCSFARCSQITDTGAVVRRGFVRDASITSTEGALEWDSSSDWEGTTFVMGATNSHAIEIVSGATQTFTEIFFTGYGGTPGSNLVAASGPTNAAVYNTAATLVTLSIIDGDIPAVRNAASSTTQVNNEKIVKVTTQDANGFGLLSGVRVLLEASSGGDLPAGASVSITSTGTTASVSHTGHGLATGATVVIRGANEGPYNGVFTISNVTTNAYDYTMASDPVDTATGSPTATAVILSGTTNVSGVIQESAFNYTSDQPVVGVARLASSSPYYRSQAIVGTITTAGFDNVTLLQPDE